jgi:hypothetical protein
MSLSCLPCGSRRGVRKVLAPWLSEGSAKKSPKDAEASWRRAQHALWVGDAAEVLKTGDVVLFSSKHSTSYIAKVFTSSRWDHIGLVVKPSPTAVYIVEWAQGLFAARLLDRLNEFAEYDALELVVRRLKYTQPGTQALVEERIEKFVDMLCAARRAQVLLLLPLLPLLLPLLLLLLLPPHHMLQCLAKRCLASQPAARCAAHIVVSVRCWARVAACAHSLSRSERPDPTLALTLTLTPTQP